MSSQTERETLTTIYRQLQCIDLNGKTGAPDKVRTRDPLITNQVLYQLSYKGNPVRVELPDSFSV